MRGSRFLLGLAVALAAAGCARQQPAYYTIDPQTGQPVPALAQQAPSPYGQPAYAQQPYAQQAYQQSQTPQSARTDHRGLFSSSPAYAQQNYEQPPVVQPSYQTPAAQPPSAQSTERGLFNTPGLFSGRSSAPVYAQQPAYAHYAPPQPRYAPAPQRAAPAPRYTGSIGGPYVATPAPVVLRGVPAPAPAYALAAVPTNYQPAYTLGSGDRLRIVVYGQEGITSTYLVGADGNVNLPLIGSVPARGFTTQQLSQMIAERLKQGYVREPHVSVEVEVYRPFFILGEVTTPGQYPYVANMTAETAVAIAGGFSPRADKRQVILTHNAPGQPFRGPVPLNYPVQPGDTVLVKERWF